MLALVERACLEMRDTQRLHQVIARCIDCAAQAGWRWVFHPARGSQKVPGMKRSGLLAMVVVCGACEGPGGPSGGPGTGGDPGEPGAPGEPGGDDGGDSTPWLTGGSFAVEVQSAAVVGNTASVTFRLTDGSGVPLDREGLLTDGEVTLAFGLSWLDQDDGQPGQYTSYVTQVQDSPLTGDSAVQATTESDGTFEAVDRADGVFRYTFATPIATKRPDRTQTVLVSGSRPVDGTDQRASAVFHFLLDGSPATVTREVVSDATCNACHGAIEGHGGRYTSTSACITCHTPQTTDPDTGNTLDFRVMVHRIHRGASLPSVLGGTPYQIIGRNQSVHDFSTVHFPQEIARCVSCHAGAQGNYWGARTAREACLSCHDNVSFTEPVPVGQVLHSGGVQPETAPCTVCHPASGSIAGVADVHMLPAFDPASPELVIELIDVINSGPGLAPTVRFRVELDGAPLDIATSPLTHLDATFAGPNTDYTSFWQATIQGAGAAGLLTAVDAPAGIFDYTTAGIAAIPVDATGSYSVGFEGYLQAVGGPRYAAASPVRAFAVTDVVPVERRQVVDSARCDGCHFDLAAHGGGRKGARYCVLCHNPSNANDERAAQLEGATILVESVDFKVMIHKIHAGEDLSQAYFVGGFPAPSALDPDGTPIDFGEVRYPRDRTDCAACHDGDTFTLPLAAGVLSSRREERTCVEDSSTDLNDFCEAPNWSLSEVVSIPPATAVCTSCHDAPSVAAHAEVMTTASGQESCATCHGPGSSLDVSVVHSL